MVIFENKLSMVMICWLILFLYWLVSSFFVKPSATKPNWSFAILWRAIATVLVILFFIFNRSIAISFIRFLIFRSFLSYGFVGTVLTVLGLITALWARILLGRNWSSYHTYKKEHELITTGPYRFLRHPIYSGVILMFIGTFLYYGVLIILVIFANAALVIAWRMGREEKIMINLFGEKYTDYMKRTKKLIPWIY